MAISIIDFLLISGGRRPVSGGRGGNRGGPSNRNKAAPTLEELDAELDAYVTNS